MRRAAVYARYSTALQSERSVDDQIDLCRSFAEAQGLSVVATYADRARSGTTTHGRDGLSGLVQDARAGAFEVIVVEALDRLSRDQEDLAGLHKRLTFAGVEIIAVHDGKADALQVGIRGLVSSLWIADLKTKIRRGMSGRVKDGRSPGGRAYGYRPTPGDPGRPTINEEEAAVVRRIFSQYLAGHSPRDIAGALNAEGVPGPRGARWAAATINGNSKRGHGILQNPLYSGRLVWNRVRMVRDPDTGRRVSRPNPPELWQEAQAPELAIVDPATWEAAQGHRAERGNGPQEAPARKRRRILSGLLRCGRCGGGMSAHDAWGEDGAARIRCSTEKESGACDNRRRYRLDKIERAVIEGVAARLSDRTALQAYIDGFQEERRAETKARARLEKTAQEVRGKIERMSRMLVDGRVAEDFFDREMPVARAELAELEARLAAAPAEKVVTLHPAALKAFRRAMQDLAGLLRALDAERDRELVETFRALIDRVVIHDAADGGVEVEVIGLLGPLVAPGLLGGPVVAEVCSPLPPQFLWGRFAA